MPRKYLLPDIDHAIGFDAHQLMAGHVCVCDVCASATSSLSAHTHKHTRTTTNRIIDGIYSNCVTWRGTLVCINSCNLPMMHTGIACQPEQMPLRFQAGWMSRWMGEHWSGRHLATELHPHRDYCDAASRSLDKQTTTAGGAACNYLSRRGALCSAAIAQPVGMCGAGSTVVVHL